MDLRKLRFGFHDWNGSASDDPKTCFGCVEEVFKEYASGKPLPTFEEWRAECPGKNYWDFFYDRGVPRDVTIQMLHAIWTKHYHPLTLKRERIVREGVEEVLKLCFRAGMTNMIVSSSIDDVEGYLKMAGIKKWFDEIHVRVKSKHDTFIEILSRYNAPPDKAFYVDDTYDGLIHAKRAGLITFGMLTGCQSEELIRSAEPDHPVHSYGEIYEILTAN